MSKNINQIYMANPITSNTSTDLMYFGQSPYGVGNDAAMTYANFAAQFGAPYTPAALTRTNDTNVTLTLGGTPSTALLAATSLTLGWTGTLSGTRGGTGVNNGASTITIGGNFAMSGAFTFTGTVTGNTTVTFPTSGTLYPVGGALGTPSSGTLTNCTGLPISTGVSGLGTGVATALAVNVGTAGSFVVNGGALGTPSSGTLTNATGLPIGGITGLGTGVGTALAQNVLGSGGIGLASTGSWTPGISFGGGTTGITYAVQSGEYTQIGNIVFINGRIQLTSKGSSTGQALITGLPINAIDGNSTFTSFPQNLTIHNSNFSIVPNSGGSGANAMAMYYTISATTGGAYADTDFQDTTVFFFSGFYFSA